MANTIQVKLYIFPDGSTYLDAQDMETVAIMYKETTSIIMAQIDRPGRCENIFYNNEIIQAMPAIHGHPEIQKLMHFKCKAVQVNMIQLPQENHITNKQQPISTTSISFVQFNQLKQITTDLQQQLNLANQKIAMLTSEFHFEFNLLKQQNAELLRQRDSYPVATAVPFDSDLSGLEGSDETKLHFARNISAQNLSDYQA